MCIVHNQVYLFLRGTGKEDHGKEEKNNWKVSHILKIEKSVYKARVISLKYDLMEVSYELAEVWFGIL
ncbi:hypothetical protein GCM10022218_17840 [Sphingobacterium ginsenosidimutans]|uniref:Uncharacterized protein n=1 Tax=Sphingobacterium ginsenosidimutans TaxID=687845 RepID=A0ABP7ZZ70_9SPHI